MNDEHRIFNIYIIIIYKSILLSLKMIVNRSIFKNKRQK